MSVLVPPLTEADDVAAEVAALRRELKLTWDSHEREHRTHDANHEREHAFSEKAIETAAELAKANKSDANEWRAAMNDRERNFATKTDVATILGRLDKIERADALSEERERQRIASAAEDKLDAERRSSRQMWAIGIGIGLIVTVVNIALRFVS